MHCNMIGETLGPYRSVFLFEFRAQTDKDPPRGGLSEIRSAVSIMRERQPADPSRRCRRQREGERFAPHIAERLKKMAIDFPMRLTATRKRRVALWHLLFFSRYLLWSRRPKAQWPRKSTRISSSTKNDVSAAHPDIRTFRGQSAHPRTECNLFRSSNDVCVLSFVWQLPCCRFV